MNEEKISSLKESSKRILLNGHNKTNIKTSFPYFSSNLLFIGSFSFAISIFFSFLIYKLSVYGLTRDDSKEIFSNSIANICPPLISTGIIILAACVYSDWRQKHEVSFILINRINSEEFMRIRYNLVLLMQKSRDEGTDIEKTDGWFPSGVSFEWENTKTFEDFVKDHALASMAYFMYQVTVYDKLKMLDRKTTEMLLHFFSSHFEILMLEFSKALKLKRLEYIEEGYPFDEIWDDFAVGIEEFFRIIGLSGDLPRNHNFIFFPSLNNKKGRIHEKKEKYSQKYV